MSDHNYIVVGAGSAGCAIAARLSEGSDAGVAVLEAGSYQLPPQAAHNMVLSALAPERGL